MAPASRRAEPAPLRNRRFLLGVLLLLLLAAVWIAWPYRAGIILALFLAYILHRPYRGVLRLVRWRPAAGLLMLLLVTVALVAPLAFVGWELTKEVSGLAAPIRSGVYRDQVVSFLESLGVPEEQARRAIATAFQEVTAFLQGLLVEALTATFDIVLGFVVFFILLYYLLVDGPGAVAAFHRYVPLSPPRRERLLAATGLRVRAIILGTFVVYAAQGIVGGIGWWIFGFPAPVFWGFVMTLFAILPFLGPQLVTVPAGIIAMVQGNWFGGIGILVWTFVAVALIDDVLRPWLIGRQSGVHPALILVGTLGGLATMGLAGLVLGPLLLGLIQPVLATWRDANGDGEEAGPDEAGPDEAGQGAIL